MMSKASPLRRFSYPIGLLFCAALAACGGSGDTSPTAVSPESASQTAAGAEPTTADTGAGSAVPKTPVGSLIISGKDVAEAPAMGTIRSRVVYEGPITGFGSVIVNNVRFADNNAAVHDESRSSMARADLKLGTYVRIEGATETDNEGTRGSAQTITVLPTLRGRIEAIDPVTGSLTVLTHTVLVDSATVYEGASRSNPLLVGDYVEVHGIAGNETVLATLIERKSEAPYVATIRGVIKNYTPWGHFCIGPLLINYDKAQITPGAQALADGVFVTVRASREPEGVRLFADTITVRTQASSQQGGADVLEFKGIVETQADSEGQFKVSGVKVLPLTANTLPKGGFLVGQRVGLRGAFAGEVFRAERVTTETSGPTPGGQINRLLGTAANRVGKTFSVNGVPVDGSSAIVDGGSLENLPAGSFVEVQGKTEADVQGTVVKASSIRIRTQPAADAPSADGQLQHVYGAVYGFVSPAEFKLNGMPVDASQARYRRGDADALANDRHIEVHGVIRNGVLIASEVEFKRHRVGGGAHHAPMHKGHDQNR